MTISTRLALSTVLAVAILLVILGLDIYYMRETMSAVESANIDPNKLNAIRELHSSHELRLTLLAIVLAAIYAVFSWLTNRDLTRTLLQLVSGLVHTTGELSKASQQVARNSNELSGGAARQAASLEETSSTMQEINTQIRGNASSSAYVSEHVKTVMDLAKASEENTRRSTELSAEARAAAESGVKAMGDISAAMREIQQGSTRITDIIEVIDTITHQTKMLATNAAIEAARAGEQGKGFAVVADEVSKLAENSKKAAREIGDLIRQSVSQARNGGKLASEGENALQNILEQVVQVGDLIQDVTNSAAEQYQKISEVERLVSDIKRSSSDQANGAEQVSEAIHDMNHVTQGTASSAESLATAAEELSAQAHTLSDLVQRLSQQTGHHATQPSPMQRPSRPALLPAPTAKRPPAPPPKALPAASSGPSSKKGFSKATAPAAKTSTPVAAEPKSPASGVGKRVKPSEIIPMRDDFSEF